MQEGEKSRMSVNTADLRYTHRNSRQGQGPFARGFDGTSQQTFSKGVFKALWTAWLCTTAQVWKAATDNV